MLFINTSIFFKMSLTFKDWNYIKEYPSLSLEQLQKAYEIKKNDISYIQFRLERFNCSCLPEDPLILLHETDDGSLTAQFPRLSRPSCSSCEKCFAPFPSHLVGAGYSWIDHYHPYLLLKMAEHAHECLEKAIFCKKEQYDLLTNEKLEELLKETFIYSRYLDKTQTDFLWSNEDSPEGLGSEMNTTEKEIEALEFEIKSRRLRGLM